MTTRKRRTGEESAALLRAIAASILWEVQGVFQNNAEYPILRDRLPRFISNKIYDLPYIKTGLVSAKGAEMLAAGAKKSQLCWDHPHGRQRSGEAFRDAFERGELTLDSTVKMLDEYRVVNLVTREENNGPLKRIQTDPSKREYTPEMIYAEAGIDLVPVPRSTGTRGRASKVYKVGAAEYQSIEAAADAAGVSKWRFSKQLNKPGSSFTSEKRTAA